MLFNISKNFPEYKLIIIGEGPLQEQLLEQTKELNL